MAKTIILISLLAVALFFVGWGLLWLAVKAREYFDADRIAARNERIEAEDLLAELERATARANRRGKTK